MFLALLLWLVVLSIVNENFLTTLNFLNVARQAAPILIIAVGMTFVRSTAGIDGREARDAEDQIERAVADDDYLHPALREPLPRWIGIIPGIKRISAMGRTSWFAPRASTDASTGSA